MKTERKNKTEDNEMSLKSLMNYYLYLYDTFPLPSHNVLTAITTVNEHMIHSESSV